MGGPASFSSSSFSYGFTYDVFLNFRGLDARYGFTGNLYKALHQRGIYTFIDDEELQRGEEITPSLEKAIKESRIAITVFSQNYADSSFCLDELVTIVDCIKAKDRLVLPVFYDIDPSQARYQSGTYGKAMAKHEKRFKDDRLEKWKMALRQAAHLSGYHFKPGNEYEHEIIEKIVNDVSNKINRAPLHVADYPVGLESRVVKVNSLLQVGSDDGVQMVGIYGIGGIGKTTLARAIYNFIADQFEGFCFLDDVRENSIKHGLVHLQETLLFEIVGEKDIKIASVNKGISIIKHRLHRKKVLLILDDVDKPEQLRAIIGGHDWFGSGSRIIITTRNQHLLASHGVERTYEVDGLNKKEALELLSWNAFKNDKVDPSYEDILNHLVSYASGLPLALEVIGSNLFGKSVEEWNSALDRYEGIPHKEIQKILKVSFDDLEEDEQKIFLDIACFFKGYELAKVNEILSAHHGVNPKYGIGVLVDRSLIKISLGNRVKLHELVQDMGKEIVRQESPEEPGERSRLWFHEDIVQVLKENTVRKTDTMGTGKVQIIILEFPNFEEEEEEEEEELVVEWDGMAFKKMKNLKTLIIRKVRFSEGPKHLPNSLRVLEWWGYPSQSLPYGFHPEKLVIFKLPNSCITSLGFPKTRKKFMSLRVLNFDDCEFLTKIPDVSGVLNLEELSFQDCENLIKVDESVGLLGKLRNLDAQGCRNLTSFPPIKLTSLENLDLSYCLSLEKFPEILGKMENITRLLLEYTPIKELPFSIQYLTRLKTIELYKCGLVQLPSSIGMLPELVEVSISEWPNQDGEEEEISLESSNESLSLWNYNMSDESFAIVLTCFVNVKQLGLSHLYFTILPACITECCFLKELNLCDCHYLQEIRGIPPNLKTFSAIRCRSLKYLDLTTGTKEYCFLRRLVLDDCENLLEIRGIPPNLKTFSAIRCRSLRSLDLTVLPAGTKEYCLLRRLILDDCENLQEIRGIPPNLETFSAIRCKSLKDLDLTVLPAASQNFAF